MKNQDIKVGDYCLVISPYDVLAGNVIKVIDNNYHRSAYLFWLPNSLEKSFAYRHELVPITPTLKYLFKKSDNSIDFS